LLGAASAIARVEPLLLGVGRPFRLSAAEGVRRIVVPSVVPCILLGIRVAPPRAIAAPLFVEMLTSLPGTGVGMIQCGRNFQSIQVHALLVMGGLFGFVVNDLFALIEAIILQRLDLFARLWPLNG
jgi:ABC-type nitrate/sulfonate/bicarbonate transport system permease component